MELNARVVAITSIAVTVMLGAVFGLIALAKWRGAAGHAASLEAAKPAAAPPAPAAAPPRPPVPLPEPRAEKPASTNWSEPALVGAAFVGFLFVCYVIGMVREVAWIARDAASRGQQPGVWIGLFLGIHVVAIRVPFWSASVIGLFYFWIALPALILFAWLVAGIYHLSRRRGALVVCRHCHNERLTYCLTCVHCGASSQEANLPHPNLRAS